MNSGLLLQEGTPYNPRYHFEVWNIIPRALSSATYIRLTRLLG